MSWNISRSLLASVLRQQLPTIVTTARDGATATEKPLAALAGQAMWEALKGVSDDALVEMQFHGSDLPSQDARVFFISITTRRIKPVTEVPAVPEAPWVPIETNVLTPPTNAEGGTTGDTTAGT
jgi:hypothetical protein